ncbi:hypothetical protein EHS25_004791 [Saitozyma podzolica]|uniref:NAD-dependent epimerase/dehydratase domain-containing protein n=1 Tax=Saitozyma podzolica TaxID=1890683 RepID=A0A427Y347_9TREE|nr:hypothetical protein EHS25_004791 [Saitozyma podzolica]
MSFTFKRIEPGSLVLVTGATGLIGSSVAVLLLDSGYKVRAATRSVEKQKPFQQMLESNYGKDAIEFVGVKDYTDPAAWDEILKDVQGVIHLASDLSFSPKYEEVVPTVEALTKTFINATSKASSVKSVVLTSSRIAAYDPVFGQDLNVTVNDWADYHIDNAKAIKQDDPMAPIAIYAASKVVGEHMAWDFVKHNRPHFAFNTVLPEFVAGPVANPTPGMYSTHTFLNDLFLGKSDGPAVAFMRPAGRFVDVRDVAAVHVAGLLETHLDGQRLWASAHKHTIDDILAAWREAFPDRKILPDFKFPNQPDINVDDEQSTALLKAFTGGIGTLSRRQSSPTCKACFSSSERI